MIAVRPYNPQTDYDFVVLLYKAKDSFGGQFDTERDSEEKLLKLSTAKKESILVAECDGNIVGTVTLFEDGRTAWLYRFAIVTDGRESEIVQALFAEGQRVLKKLGHTQVLVYAPVGDTHFQQRYSSLGFTKGNDFTAYWQDLA
jgi:predicted N-acetyltransferase YhbS